MRARGNTVSPRLRSWALVLVKLIGVALFFYILSRIDRFQLWATLVDADVGQVLLAAALLLASYVFKTLRWHTLVKSAGLEPTLDDSWRLFHIGLFFGHLTPSNAGEVVRAFYLRSDGMHGATAVSLVVIDRLCDVGLIALIAGGAIVVAFGLKVAALSVLAGLGVLFVLALARRRLKRLVDHCAWLSFLRRLFSIHFGSRLVGTTLATWCLYFAWTTTLGRAVGIDLPLPIMVSILTLAGIISLLPVAPAGLGTRDAALLALLGLYGIPPERSVALSLTMAGLILASCLFGAVYWMTGLRKGRGTREMHD